MSFTVVRTLSPVLHVRNDGRRKLQQCERVHSGNASNLVGVRIGWAAVILPPYLIFRVRRVLGILATLASKTPDRGPIDVGVAVPVKSLCSRRGSSGGGSSSAAATVIASIAQCSQCFDSGLLGSAGCHDLTVGGGSLNNKLRQYDSQCFAITTTAMLCNTWQEQLAK